MFLMVDDDTVVIEKALEDFIIYIEDRALDHGESVSPPFCSSHWTISNHPPTRPGDKYADKSGVTKEIYPKNFYPPFCSGTCYIISSTYARNIYRTAVLTNPDKFHLEDVLFTGILRVKADIDIPKEVKGICQHYDKITKTEEIRNLVLKYCLENNISQSSCFITDMMTYIK